MRDNSKYLHVAHRVRDRYSPDSWTPWMHVLWNVLWKFILNINLFFKLTLQTPLFFHHMFVFLLSQLHWPPMFWFSSGTFCFAEEVDSVIWQPSGVCLRFQVLSFLWYDFVRSGTFLYFDLFTLFYIFTLNSRMVQWHSHMVYFPLFILFERFT